MHARLLFVSNSVEWLGATRSLLLLVRHLRARYDAAVLLPGRPGPFAEALRKEAVPVVRARSLSAGAIPGLARRIRRDGYRLVYGNNTSSAVRNALIAARLARVPRVCHVRAMGGGNGRVSALRYGLADTVVAISAACARSLGGRVPAARLRVVHNGVDAAAFAQRDPAAAAMLRAELGLPAAAVIAVGVGHVKPRKGQEHAVRALAACARAGVDITLLLAGHLDRDAAYVERVRAVAAEQGVAGRVRLLGFREDVRPLLAAADLAVHTAVAEAFGRAVIEAMATGLPVAAFAADGVAEIVRHGETGLLVAPGDDAALADALARLARSPALRHRLGAAGRRAAEERFSAAAAAERVAEVIDAVLAGRAA